MRTIAVVLLLAAAARAGDDLVERLGSADWSVVGPALDELRALPPADAVRIVPQLLQVDMAFVRARAAEVLGPLGPRAAPAVEALVALAFDEDGGVRGQASMTLGLLGPAAWKALPLVPEMEAYVGLTARQGAGYPDGPVKDVWAAAGWRQIGASLGDGTDLAELEAAFRHPHPYVRHRAALALRRRGDAALPALGRLAQDPSVRVRRRALSTLSAMARGCAGAVPILVAALDDPDDATRCGAVQGLGAARALGPLQEFASREIDPMTLSWLLQAFELADREAAQPLLRRAFRSENRDVRAMAVSYVGTNARPLLQEVIDALFDEDPSVAQAARRALFLARATPDEVAPWLREIKTDMPLEPNMAASTARLPRRIDADADDDRLAAALSGEDGLAAGQAAELLAVREPKTAERARLLAATLRHESNYARAKAAAALAAYGDRGVFALAAALDDESARVRRRAIDALGSMGAVARDAVPALMGQLDGDLWPSASEALVKIGPGAAGALPGLLAVLRGADDYRASAAIGVIAAIGDEAKSAIPMLMEALDRPGCRWSAAAALGAFGPAAEPAVPKLRQLARESTNEWLDMAIYQALLRIGGEGHRAIADYIIKYPTTFRYSRNLIRETNAGSSELVETLEQLTHSPDAKVAARARESLAYVQPTADLKPAELIVAMEADTWGNELRARALAEKASVEELVAALPGTKGWGSWGIVVALGLKGPEAREAAPAVARCFAEPEFPQTRVAAAATLVKIEGALAQPRLLDALRAKPSGEVAVAIEKALAECGDVPGLAKALSDESPTVRAAAMRALDRIDPPPKEAVRALVANLASRTLYVRGVERILVKRKDEALPLVVALLRMDDDDVRARTLAVLGEMGAEALPHVTEALKDRDPLLRVAAVEALGRIGKAGRPEAKRALREDPNPRVREAAVVVLLRDPADAEAAAIAFDDPEICGRAVRCVAFGDRGALLVEALGHVAARQAALRELDRVAPGAVLPALRKAVAERTGEAQAGAALGLASLGEVHIEGLRAALASSDAETKRRACRHLATVGPDAAPAAQDLVAVLDAGDRTTCTFALIALGSLGRAAEAHIPALRARAEKAIELPAHYIVAIARIEGDPERLAKLIRAVGVGPALFEALAYSGGAGARELGELLVRTEGKDQDQVAQFLTRAGEPAVPVAVALLKHERAEIRVRAAAVLGKMGYRGREAVPALADALKDPELKVRLRVVETLGKIGPPAAPALPALEELRKEKDMTTAVDEAISLIR